MNPRPNAQMSEEIKPFRVLCLDGGGMRGLYTGAVLNTLALRFSPKEPLDIGKGFDIIAGTSTGGILACALAAGVPLDKVLDLYRKEGPAIFTCPLPRYSLFKILWAAWNWRTPANKNDHLKKSIENILGSETIGQLYERRKIGLCIPAVNLATHESRVFKTAHDPKRNADDDRQLAEVCLATSAAPIVLPIAGVPNPHTADQLSFFADGGLWANNPVLVGLVEALHISDPKRPIEIISIGTCPPPSGGALLPKEAKRGILGWNFGIKALELSMDAQASGHQFMAKFLAEHLRRCGRNVTLLRFDQSAPSSEQSNYLGLDSATQRACSTLIELGNSDALKLYGRALDPESEYNILEKIFKTMPVLSKQIKE